MKKITFVDLNKSLVSKVKTIFDANTSNKQNIELTTYCGDIIEYHKKHGGYIATASNPHFAMGGGLDNAIKKNFPEEIRECSEFSFSNNLFFTITVDENLQTNGSIIARALIGCFAYANKNIIISGFGTGVGGIDHEVFLSTLQQTINKNLVDANLSNANLTDADLSGADLTDADLSGADLSGANLSNANLSGANLKYANLSGANLKYADLKYADLRDADLKYADLKYANLSDADLKYADLRDADLKYADLKYANLSDAKLNGAKLSSVKYGDSTAFYALACPEEGEFIAFKKVKNCIIKLRIPAEAKRSSATTRKCRAEFADVLEIKSEDGKKLKTITNEEYHTTIYKVGERVYPDAWDNNRWVECTNGIHFFITREEAEKR